MATESPIRILETNGKWPSHNEMAAFGQPSTNMGIEDLGLLLKAQNFQEKQRTSAPNRSGSAPPTMEGSFAAIENLMFRHKIAENVSLASPNRHIDTSESEEQLRADPSYFAYYSAHVNLNPRLPPPLISDENRHLFRNLGSTGNNRRLPSFDDSNGSFHLTQSNLSTHKEESDDDRSPKQEDSPRDPPPLHEQSRSFRHESIEEAYNHDGNDTGQLLYSDPATAPISSSSSYRSPISHSEDDVSTSAVTDTDVSGITNGIVAIHVSESQTNHIDHQQRSMLQVHSLHPQIVSQSQTYTGMNQYLQNPSNFSSEVQRVLQSSGYASGSAYIMSGNHVYPNMVPSGYFPQQYVGGYTFNPTSISPYVTGYLPTGPVPMPFDINGSPSFMGQNQTSGVNLQHLNKFYGLPIQPPFAESLQLSTCGDDQIQKQQSLGIMGHGNLNFGSPNNMGILQFPTSSFASPPMPGSPIRGVSFSGGRNGIRSPSGPYGGWQAHSGHQVFKDPKTYSFLEELKSGKGRRLELSDIFGHIVEFCGDQHGSRFIQQKLEICSIEDKESVFKEVLPNASSLITDVFGNYVIQKFFEYGSGEQRRELAHQLEGQILPLSLQMYGCRVIQKALDVIEVEQKMKLVGELDGHVLRCVRDQNGNHVIQKCIETIPMDKIKFVISSFRGQVAALSTHPYGCRVIQRVLEHSTDELQSQFIVDEILESVYTLAQDQYGNYVTQHVLKRGKPEERSQIVHKLAGHVVQLSQHKFASNVIEKCLEYGDPTARGILIEEIVGLGDNSQNLLAMVKDQFANYVIQKVLQTCTGDQREVLLGRIKIHLNSLKKYTYGKHIVTRFEQLCDEEVEASSS